MDLPGAVAQRIEGRRILARSLREGRLRACMRRLGGGEANSSTWGGERPATLRRRCKWDANKRVLFSLPFQQKRPRRRLRSRNREATSDAEFFPVHFWKALPKLVSLKHTSRTHARVRS